MAVEKLDLDVWNLILSHLLTTDLYAVALTSRAFQFGVIPRLYHTIFFRTQHARRYPGMMTAFQAILQHPELAMQVRCVEIRALPTNTKLKATFLSECTRVIDLCTELSSFKCTVPVLPEFLPSLQGLKDGLRTLRIPGNLSTPEAEMLLKIGDLDSLSIDQGTWNVIDILPRWTEGSSLTELILFMTKELNEDVLGSVLQCLRNLRSLHIVGCPQIDHVSVLRLCKHLPALESLTLNASDSLCPLDDDEGFPKLPRLRHIAFDTRYSRSIPPALDALYLVLECLQDSAPCLSSFTIRLSDKKTLVDYDFLKKLLKQHRRTLRQLAFLDCSLDMKHVTMICKNCVRLERLELPFPLKELVPFASALARSDTLQTIVDTQAFHGAYISLTPQNVRLLMEAAPALSTIISDRRVWKGYSDGVGRLNNISFRTLPTQGASSYWFLPAEL
ncbi:hypothetical protein D9758_010058 [Tetrapyrgos nigripes]|uniref:F-box domain-containing protein n=1 Tax=Tetrapyrgos nigripes TaxID=182062 RepID=A0A8H5CU06_9AGAR|nr:hypothetical protein D9758_010058 [Tetrapyrgos nigripes]